MNINDIAVSMLLVSGVLLYALTSAGLLLASEVNDQIHYLAPGTLIGSVVVTFAVLLHEGFSQAGVKAILIMTLLIISNPVLSHATARANRIRKVHQLPPTPAEHIPFAKDEP